MVFLAISFQWDRYIVQFVLDDAAGFPIDTVSVRQMRGFIKCAESSKHVFFQPR